MLSSPLMHDWFKDIIYRKPEDILSILKDGRRFPRSAILSNYTFIGKRKEKTFYIPKRRHNGDIPDYKNERGIVDVAYELQQLDYDCEIYAYIYHEIKTGTFDINDILDKYLYSSITFNVKGKKITDYICGGNRSPLYIWGWHDVIKEQIPRIKNKEFLKAFHKGNLKIVPLEWICGLLKIEVHNTINELKDPKSWESVELVDPLPYIWYKKLVPKTAKEISTLFDGFKTGDE